MAVSTAQKKELFASSRPVAKLDIFLSHTWRTPGKWKFLSLLLHSGWRQILGFWAMGTALGFALCMLEVLPLFLMRGFDGIGFNEVVPDGCWVAFCGLLSTLGGMAAFPYLPLGG